MPLYVFLHPKLLMSTQSTRQHNWEQSSFYDEAADVKMKVLLFKKYPAIDDLALEQLS